MIPTLILQAVLGSIIALVHAGAVFAAASFPCDKAATAAEKAVCADPELSRLDEHLGRYYQAARMELRESASCLAADQRLWLRTVRDACRDNTCLRNAYLQRLAELDALQPGVTAVKDFVLPARPALVWIVPPAQDQVAALAKPNAKPLEARGRLIDDVEKGDGFVLRTAEGRSYLIAMLMFLGGDTAGRLSMLAKDARATFLARGHAATDDKGRTHYEPSRCTFVYRLP
jgi:uncharacterized protein